MKVTLLEAGDGQRKILIEDTPPEPLEPKDEAGRKILAEVELHRLRSSIREFRGTFGTKIQNELGVRPLFCFCLPMSQRRLPFHSDVCLALQALCDL